MGDVRRKTAELEISPLLETPTATEDDSISMQRQGQQQRVGAQLNLEGPNQFRIDTPKTPSNPTINFQYSSVVRGFRADSLLGLCHELQGHG